MKEIVTDVVASINEGNVLDGKGVRCAIWKVGRDSKTLVKNEHFSNEEQVSVPWKKPCKKEKQKKRERILKTEETLPGALNIPNEFRSIVDPVAMELLSTLCLVISAGPVVQVSEATVKTHS